MKTFLVKIKEAPYRLNQRIQCLNVTFKETNIALILSLSFVMLIEIGRVNNKQRFQLKRPCKTGSSDHEMETLLGLSSSYGDDSWLWLRNG
jgi:hypothetical protein